MNISRSILTKIDLMPTNEYLLQEAVVHGGLYGRVLSAAKVSRALLTACALANTPIGHLEDEDALTAWIAAALKRHMEETRA